MNETPLECPGAARSGEEGKRKWPLGNGETHAASCLSAAAARVGSLECVHCHCELIIAVAGAVADITMSPENVYVARRSAETT